MDVYNYTTATVNKSENTSSLEQLDHQYASEHLVYMVVIVPVHALKTSLLVIYLFVVNKTEYTQHDGTTSAF